MNTEKINDFVNCYSEAINLPTEYQRILNELMINLIDKYSKQYKEIPISMDDYDKYVIKPENGKYSIEDFFLNRLMRNTWELNKESPYKGHYDANNMSVNINEEKLKTQLSKVLNYSIPNFDELNEIAKKKVIMHEFEHSMQTRFTKGELDLRYRGKYKNIIDKIKEFDNGKYANKINSYEDLMNKTESTANIEKYINTGLHYSHSAKEKNTYRNVEGFDNLNEIFNETESLEMSNAKVQVVRTYPDGLYYPLKNAESSNRDITNYGELLKILLGEKTTFEGMYIAPNKMFETFNNRYNDIFKEKYHNEKSAWENLINQIDEIKKTNSKDLHLQLQETLAECFDRKIEHNMQKMSPEKMKEELNKFKNNSIWCKDKNTRDNLKHVQILKAVKEKVNTYEKDINKGNNPINNAINNTQKNNIKTTTIKENEFSNLKFAKGFIKAYENTEEKYQYETRVQDEEFDMKRVKEIIVKNGMNRLEYSDLDGKNIEIPGQDGFKVEYSQKQVSTMARLLKSAELLTKNKQLNPEGIDYLKEFIKVPNIEYKLNQMKNDLNDENSYMYKLKQTDKENRESGNIPKFPKTDAEKDANNSNSTIDMGMSMTINASNEKKEENNYLKYLKEQEEQKRKENNENSETTKINTENKSKTNAFIKSAELNQNNAKIQNNNRNITTIGTEPQNIVNTNEKIKINAFRKAIENNKITKSEAEQQMTSIEENTSVNALTRRQQNGEKITQEEQRKVNAFKIQKQQAQAQYNQQLQMRKIQNNKGMGIGE